MKYPENIRDISEIEPDYLGLIFYEKSPRFFDDDLPEISPFIKRVGVFVDESYEFIKEKISKYQLDLIQLHGNETYEFCYTISDLKIPIIKSFPISTKFDFDILEDYEYVVDYFLFDSLGKNPGGNGIIFNWKSLERYKLTIPYFLSGGIGLTEIDSIAELLKKDCGRYCFAIDVNSRFEIRAGLKNLAKIKTFKSKLNELKI